MAGGDGAFWTDPCRRMSTYNRAYDCPSITPVQAGDLDGDGGDEVFTIEHGLAGWTVRARRGIDGSTLWAHAIHENPLGSHVYLARLARPGPDPVLLLSIEEDDGGVKPADWIYGSAIRLRQAVSLLDPATGAVVWERVFDAQIVLTYWGEPTVTAVRGVLMDVEPLEAVPGADPDVLLRTLDAFLVFDYNPRDTGPASLLSTTMRLDGDSGVTLQTGVLSGFPAIAPARDVGGTGRPGMFVSYDHVLSANEIEGTEIWRVTIVDHLAIPIPVRLSGERPDDVFVIGTLWYSSDLEAIGGSDGRRLWRLDNGWPVRVLADLDGDTSLDLIDYGSDGEHTTLEAISGRTGAPLWSNPFLLEHPGPDLTSASWWCACGTDLNSDGVVDTLLHRETYSGTGEDYWEGETVSEELVALDGATGSVMWSGPVQVSGYFRVYALAANLGGSAGHDLIYDVGYDPVPGRYKILDGATFAELGALDAPGEWRIREAFAADLVPGGTSETVAWTCEGYCAYQVVAFSGGTILWTAP